MPERIRVSPNRSMAFRMVTCGLDDCHYPRMYEPNHVLKLEIRVMVSGSIAKVHRIK